VCAAFIQKHDYFGRAKWDMPILGSEEKYPVETYTEPVQVETAVVHRWKGMQLMTPVGGGVTLHPEQALTSENSLADDGKLTKTRDSISLSKLAEGQWWWD